MVMNKKTFFAFALSLLLLPVLSVAQQDYCRDIVLPMLDNDESRLAAYPDSKLNYDCLFSCNGFYESDTIPAGAAVYDISDVVSKFDGSHLQQDMVVDINKLSYYAYNFHDFRYRHYEVPVCFRTPSSNHPFLVLRTYIETLRLTNEATGQ